MEMMMDNITGGLLGEQRDLAELLHFVLGNGGLLLQSDEESFSLLGLWVSLSSRLEEIQHQ